MEGPHFWQPSNEDIERSNIHRTMLENQIDNYKDFWRWSVDKKEEFWSQTVKNLGIVLQSPYTSILNCSEGVEKAKWLYGAKMNITDSCFQNSDNAVAVIIQEPGKPIEKITQIQLEHLVNRISNGLTERDLKAGDAIAINMPMTLEAVAIYLAGIKSGMQVVTIADSFTSDEIAIRLQITKPKLIFTEAYIQRAEKQLPLYEKIKQVDAPVAIVLNRSETEFELRNQDLIWKEFISSEINFKSVAQQPDDTITILFSSGTTGQPKAIPWTHTTPIKGASDGYYHHNIQQNDVVCWPTNLGWMMGPWLVFSTLINKAAIGLYYGSPTETDFGKFVQNARVTMLGVIPSFVNYWMRRKCMENFNWDAIKCFSSTGEVSNSNEMWYLMNLAKNKPVIEYCGGTEIGGGYVTSTVVQKNIPSTFSTQALGGEFILLNSDNERDQKGEVFIVPPIMGLSTSLINRDHQEVYYKDTPVVDKLTLRRHGDQMTQLPSGYYKAQGRVDDAMNLGGIKVSSIQIESVLNTLDFIVECAAIGIPPKEGGPEMLVIYYVENKTAAASNRFEIAKNYIRTKLNPLFKLVDLISIDVLPRTASNKVMRRKLRDQYKSET